MDFKSGFLLDFLCQMGVGVTSDGVNWPYLHAEQTE